MERDPERPNNDTDMVTDVNGELNHTVYSLWATKSIRCGTNWRSKVFGYYNYFTINKSQTSGGITRTSCIRTNRVRITSPPCCRSFTNYYRPGLVAHCKMRISENLPSDVTTFQPAMYSILPELVSRVKMRVAYILCTFESRSSDFELFSLKFL